jgi:hypothetical protein
MPWAKFDDRYPWHRKVRPLSDAAFRLDVSAICWCAENLTDGVILPENPTREKVEEDREKRRKAGALGGVASGQSRQAKPKQSASGLPSKTEAPVASSPTNPRTRTPSPTTTTSVQGVSHLSRGDDEPPLYPDRCSKHGNTYEPGNCGNCADARKAKQRLASVGAHNPATVPHCGECDETRMLRTRFGAIPCPNCNPAAEAS